MKINFIKIFLASLVYSSASFADINIGTYAGKTATGDTCAMQVQSVFFLNDIKHPLNERVKIVVSGKEYTVQHPTIISVSDVLASFNHDQFQGVLATPDGALALVVDVVHTEEYKGPTQFHVIDHNYRTGSKALTSCLQLKFSN